MKDGMHPQKSCGNCINQCKSECERCRFYDGVECHQQVDCCRDCLDADNWELDD